MSRIETMSRFAEPAEEKTLEVCDGCLKDLYKGETVLEYLYGEVYCSASCFAEHRAEEKTLGE